MRDDLDFFKSEQDLINYVLEITGQHYSFAQASVRKWNTKEERDGLFYQLMPDTEDDDFFDWYCDKKPFQQFFVFPEECVMRFIRYWFEWKQLQN